MWEFTEGFDYEVHELPAHEIARAFVLKYGYVPLLARAAGVMCVDDARFFNHSDDPNCLEIGDNTVARHDLQPGTELTTNYASLRATRSPGSSEPSRHGGDGKFLRLLRMPPLSAQHDGLGQDPLVAGQHLAAHVDIVESALGDCEDGGVTERAGPQRAIFGPAYGRRRIYRAGGDDIVELHSKAKEFRQRRDLVEGRSVDAQRVDVR